MLIKLLFGRRFAYFEKIFKAEGQKVGKGGTSSEREKFDNKSQLLIPCATDSVYLC